MSQNNQPGSINNNSDSFKSPALSIFGSLSDSAISGSGISAITENDANVLWCVICQAPMRHITAEDLQYQETKDEKNNGSPIALNNENEGATTIDQERPIGSSGLPLSAPLQSSADVKLKSTLVRGTDIRPTDNSGVLLPNGMILKGDEVTLACKHAYHRQCFFQFLHYASDNITCPLCRSPIDLSPFKSVLWRINNVAVRTKASPESIRLGLRQTGWINCQLSIIPPAGKQLESVRYVFHPAFSLNCMFINGDNVNKDLVVKLVSNSVEVVIDAKTTDGTLFTMIHTLSKEICNRIFIENEFTGISVSSTLGNRTDRDIKKTPDGRIDSLKYFEDLLPSYRRDPDYYYKQMPPPPRFQTPGNVPKPNAVDNQNIPPEMVNGNNVFNPQNIPPNANENNQNNHNNHNNQDNNGSGGLFSRVWSRIHEPQ